MLCNTAVTHVHQLFDHIQDISHQAYIHALHASYHLHRLGSQDLLSWSFVHVRVYTVHHDQGVLLFTQALIDRAR